MTSVLESMEVTCPTCTSTFPVDPARVPETGILAICSTCLRTFPVARPEGWQPVVDMGGLEALEAADGEVVEPAADEAEAVEVIDLDEVELEAGPVVLDAQVEEAAAEVEDLAMEPGTEPAEEPASPEEPEVVALDGEPLDEPADGLDAALPGTMVEEVVRPMESGHDLDAGGDDRDGSVEVADGSPDEPALERAVPEDTLAEPTFPGEAREELADDEPAATPIPGSPAFTFGRRDPENRARRLARVLASDMITYNPARYAEARRRGSLRDDFQDEIQKSWEEYVDQVGEELARSTHHFADALNEVLAQGEPLFRGPGRPQ